MGTNQDYKNRALASLEGMWGTAAIATLIYLVLTMGINWGITVPLGDDFVISYSTSGIWALICLPLGWGFVNYFLNLIRKEELNFGQLFDGYKDFVRIFVTVLMVDIATIIGLCLFIVPGIILMAGLVMTDFVMKDDKEIGYIDAMKKSWELTDGHKGDLIWLFLSFLGWMILAGLTLCIGFIFLYPYMQSALAHVYEDLKAEKQKESQTL